MSAAVPFNDLSRQEASVARRVREAIDDVLESGRFVGGPVVAQFEEAFASWCGARHAVGVASGTDAIELALRALGIGSGHEVVTAANTCAPTIAGIEAAGAEAVLADVDEGTYTIDPDSIERVLTPRTRAVVPVHLYGQCADMPRIVAIARAHGLLVVEDAAQAHGAEIEGRRPGTMGDAAAFSFYPTKNLGCLGDGGAVVTGDAEVAERVRRLRSYGEVDRFVAVEPGCNSRLDTIHAAVLLAKLPWVEEWAARRQALAALYETGLEGTGLVVPRTPPGYTHAYHLYVVRSTERDRLRAGLAARGIGTAVHYPLPVHRQPAYRKLAHPGLERAERLATEIVSLPFFPEILDEEVDLVVSALRELTR